MNFVELLSTGVVAVVSGVIVDLTGWLGRQWRVRSLALTPASLPYSEEDPQMGRPGQFSKPDLPPGSHRALIDLLHDLHLKGGGKMSLRGIAERARQPHSTVHKALTGMELPDLHVAISIGLALARAVRCDDQEALQDDVDGRIERLWMAAAREGQPPTKESVRAAVKECWGEFARGEGEWAEAATLYPGTGTDFAQLARCTLLSTDMRSGLVTVVVSTPDWDALGAVEDPQTWHRFFEAAVIRRLDYYLHVRVESVPGFDPVAHSYVSGEGRYVGPAAR